MGVRYWETSTEEIQLPASFPKIRLIRMAMAKSHILEEIKRTAAQNGGSPLGSALFEAETGIRIPDWFGIHWARWGDAVQEAGFEPNQMNSAYDKQRLLQAYAELALELGRLPVG